MEIKLLQNVLSVAVLTFILIIVGCKQPTSKGDMDNVELENQLIDSSSDTEEATKNTENTSLANPQSQVNYVFPYDINNASFSCNLSRELLEISGLSYIPSLKRFAAINDEKAILFILDVENCRIDDKYDFGRNGDYEGVEFVENSIYALKSNGNLYPFNIDTKESLSTIKTPLRMANDVEGLGYDSRTSEIIFACKGSPNIKGHAKYKDSKAIYTYNIKTKIFNEKPKFLIKDDALIEALGRNKNYTNLSKSKLKKLNKRIKNFSPSAITKHPKEGHYYILSSVGKSLIVCNENGSILDVIFLDSDLHFQPEGITFDAEGRLYISNEGKSLVAKIYRFDHL